MKFGREIVTGTQALVAAVAVVVALMAGCGGGGGGSSSPASTLLTGIFLDAPTAGLKYTASPSNLHGTTDSTGAFSYHAGDTVTFTLDVGAASSVAIGSIAPVAPTTGGNAQVFVLSLANGQQVAQVLQSLNHSSSSGYMDVGSLTMPQSAVTALTNYISSGGATLPSGKTDVQMLNAVQASVQAVAPSVIFAYPGGATSSVTATNLNATILAASGVSATSVSLDSLIPGKVFFARGIAGGTGVPGGGQTNRFGFLYFDGTATGTQYQYSDNLDDWAHQPYSMSGDQIIEPSTNTVTEGGAPVTTVATTITVPFMGSTQGAYIADEVNGHFDIGSFYSIDETFSTSAIAGKTLSVINPWSGTCVPPVQDQLVIDSTGANYTENCQGSTTVNHSGTITAVANAPGVLLFSQNGNGSNPFYLGMLSGSTIENGTFAFVNVGSSTQGGSGVGGLLQFTSSITPATTSPTGSISGTTNLPGGAAGASTYSLFALQSNYTSQTTVSNNLLNYPKFSTTGKIPFGAANTSYMYSDLIADNSGNLWTVQSSLPSNPGTNPVSTNIVKFSGASANPATLSPVSVITLPSNTVFIHGITFDGSGNLWTNQEDLKWANRAGLCLALSKASVSLNV